MRVWVWVWVCLYNVRSMLHVFAIRSSNPNEMNYACSLSLTQNTVASQSVIQCTLACVCATTFVHVCNSKRQTATSSFFGDNTLTTTTASPGPTDRSPPLQKRTIDLALTCNISIFFSNNQQATSILSLFTQDAVAVPRGFAATSVLSIDFSHTVTPSNEVAA